MAKGRTRAPPAPVETEETIAAEFGRRLYSLHASSDSPSIFDLQLRHYGDYLHHFGFSVEVERSTPGAALSRGVLFPGTSSYSLTGTGTNAATPAPSPAPAAAVAVAEGEAGDDIARAAAFGIAAAERDEADRWAETVGPLDGETDAAVVAARLAEPFARTMWRQSVAQCAIKKARAVYRWISVYVAIDPRAPAPLGKPLNPLPAAETRRTPSKANAGSVATASPTPVEVATAVLQRRVSNATNAATLYSELLRHAGVDAAVVEGHVRGRGPEEMVEWAWNEVSIPCDSSSSGGAGEARLLVDVALSAYRGPLRNGQRSGEDANANPNANANTNAQANAAASGSVSTKGRRTAGLGTASETLPRRSLFDGPLLAPMQSTAQAAVEDFYFATHPCQFAGTHFPRDPRNMLLLVPPRRVAWEQAPCLTHAFFRFPVALVSHRRRCAFTVRNTPFYVSLSNTLPDRVELCAVLFRGTLAELPEDIAAATPLGPEWVWQQREESTACETFTLMVPAAGYYSLIVGARHIRRDPFSAIVAGEEEPFEPIVAYQVLVTFVPVQVPQLPRQHASPSICKLISPLTYQVAEGSTRFTIMPSCANVAAVAIVARRTSDGTRELITFLPFSMEKVAYDGVAELCSGTEGEIWIRYAAPDHNYVNSTELSRIQSSPPSASAPTPTTRKPRGAAAAAAAAAASSDAVAATAAYNAAAMFFIPFVTRIEVRKSVALTKGPPHIAPQLSLEAEQLPTLRRLIGVTPELYEEARAVAERKAAQVGSYFAKKRPLRGSINATRE